MNNQGQAKPVAIDNNRPVGLEFPYTPPEMDGSVVKLREGILWARMPMPMKLDHINVYLLQDYDGWYLIDTGLNTCQTKDLWELIRRTHLEDMPIKGLICTHFHYDHAGLANWLTEQYSVPLYMTYGEYYTLRSLSAPMSESGQVNMHEFFMRAGLEADLSRGIINRLKQDPFMTGPPASFRRLDEGQILNIGSREWQIVIGRGHSPEHACLYCEAEEILISGDQLLPRISSNVLVSNIEPEGNPLQYWFASLDKLDQLAEQTLVLPSHQDVFKGLHKRVEELRTHHNEAFDRIRRLLADSGSCTGVECMNALFKRELKGGELMLGLGEALAHLAWMYSSGEVDVQSDHRGVNQFKLSSAPI